jgi:mono/diheme cytochrome c family protein
MIMFKHFIIGVAITGISVTACSQSFNLKASIERGKEVYVLECQSCHMAEGEGLPGVSPPVAKTDYLKQPSAFLINIILKGQTGEIVVNGTKYNTPMPAQEYLSDEKISDVLNYIRNTWTNKGAAITPAQVKTEREKNKAL